MIWLQASAVISSEGFCWRLEFPDSPDQERWNAVLTPQPLLGMFCIPLPGSGQVASSKNEGQQLPKKKKREEENNSL